MIGGCSTVGSPVPPAINTAAYCPPESAIASPQTFRSVVKIKEGETAFQTVKRFRLAEGKKNADGKRIYESYAKCRAGTEEGLKKLREAQETEAKKAANGGLFAR